MDEWVWGGRRCVTPRQTCPRPNGFGRNLRSKTRWFTGFCNSHQVSHFATFFIDARAEISVAESRIDFIEEHAARAGEHRLRAPARARSFVYIPWRRSRRGSLSRRDRSRRARGVRGTQERAPRLPRAFYKRVRGSFCSCRFRQ